MQIRNAYAEDAEPISKLISETARQHIASWLSPQGIEKLLAEMKVDSVAEKITGNYQFFVGEHERIMVAVSAIMLPTHLYYLLVRSSQQNLGFGRKLWEHSRDWVIQKFNAEEITVNSSFNAIPVYQRFGFMLSGAAKEQDGVCYQPMSWQERP